MRAKLTCLLYLLLVYSSLAQIKFYEEPNTYTKGDTIYSELNTKYVFNYFRQIYDTSHILIFGSGPIYRQIVSIHNSDESGYFRIFYNEEILMELEIRENEINGVGRIFSRRIEFCPIQGLFKNGVLDGPTIFFKDNGDIERIAWYRKGKFKKFIYYDVSKTEKNLKKGNRKAYDPFKPRTVTM